MLGHQLQTALLSDFLGIDSIELNRLLVHPDKNKLRMRGGLAALPAQHVFETAFATPNSRKTRYKRKDMREQNQASPRRGDRCQHQQAIAIQPMHERIISEIG